MHCMELFKDMMEVEEGSFFTEPGNIGAALQPLARLVIAKQISDMLVRQAVEAYALKSGGGVAAT